MTAPGRCSYVDDAGRQCAAPAGDTRNYRAHYHWYRPTVAEFLAFETEDHPAEKKQSLIEKRWGMTQMRYQLLLSRVIVTTEALETDPITTNRLLRQRDDRLARRASRTYRKAPR